MIRIDAIWLATEPMDMRAGTETALARVIAVFGAAKPHCAYLFANRRANRMKVLVHDGVGVWLAARRLNQGKFHWPGIRHGCEVENQMTPEQLRALAAQALQLQSQVEAMSRKIQNDEILIEQFKFEIALLKRHKFAKRSEQISPAQGSLLNDLLDTDLEAIEAELKQLLPAAPQAKPRQSPKRAPLPPQFPRTVIRHEPENTQCACGCQLQRIGEDVSEKLDYTPGVFTVEQHVRGKWACRQWRRS
ncbi:TPA: IS66 family insertion sequence element accessory protein TnpB [Pseudomonas putida]|nr:IS66 family insertion sequence element accessory protein TnpB [Pseudomonas putida]